MRAQGLPRAKVLAGAPEQDGSTFLVPRIIDLLAENEADDVLVVVGGTIPADDADELKAKHGVAAVFGPGAATSDIVDFLRSASSQAG